MSTVNETEIEKELSNLQNMERVLKDSIARDEKKLAEIQKRVRKLKGHSDIPWMDKAIECIDKAGELLSTEDILNCVFSHQLNELKDKRKRTRYIASLSVALNKLENSNKITKTWYTGIKGYFYGLPEWNEADGSLQGYYRLLLEAKATKINARKILEKQNRPSRGGL